MTLAGYKCDVWHNFSSFSAWICVGVVDIFIKCEISALDTLGYCQNKQNY
jgi:hypothetical protein